MFKFTKIKYGLLVAGMILPTIGFAQTDCNLKANDIHSMMYEMYYDNLGPIKANLKQECYNEINNTMHRDGRQLEFVLIDSLEDFKLLEQVNPNIYKIKNDLQQDILSMFLTKKLIFNDLDSLAEEMKEVLSIKDSQARKKVIDRQKEEELLVYLANNYVKNRIKSKDVHNRDAFSYAIYMLEPKVLEVLKENYRLEILMKGKDLMSPFHVAFVKKPKLANHENLTKVNDILTQFFEPKFAPLLKIQNLSFVDYMELMKDNNHDLYTKLMNKLNASGNKLLLNKKTGLDGLTKEQKDKLVATYEEHGNYEEKLRD